MKLVVQESSPNARRTRKLDWLYRRTLPRWGGCRAPANMEDTMGDKGGKKDKEKSQKQKTEKKAEQGKAKQEKQVKK